MDDPSIRPGAVAEPLGSADLVVAFGNAAQGNLAVQLVGMLGVRGDRLGVTPPDQLEGGQGMLLSIVSPDPAVLDRAAEVCRNLGGTVHRPTSG